MNPFEVLRKEINPLGAVIEPATVTTASPASGGEVTFVAAGAQSASSSSATDVAIPTVQEDDLLVLICVSRYDPSAASVTFTPTGSWTSRARRDYDWSATTGIQVEVFYRFATASEGSTVSVSISHTGNGWTGQIMAWRGVDPTTPWDIAGNVEGDVTNASSTFTPTGVTTATANAQAVSIVATRDSNSLALNSGNEQGFTLRAGGASYSTLNSSAQSVGVADKQIASAGAVTFPTWEQTVNGPDYAVFISDALKPAPGTSGGGGVSGTTVTVSVGGTSVPGVRVMGGLLPAEGDKVWVLRQGSTMLCLPGKVTTLSVPGNLYPAEDNTHALGSTDYRWTAVYAVNGTIQTSDPAAKVDLRESPLGLDFIRSLRGRSWRWPGHTDVHHGLDAAEVRHALGGEPFGGLHDQPGSLMGLDYSQFTAPIVNALNELADRLERLEQITRMSEYTDSADSGALDAREE